jgi:hypothetical protein
VCRSKALPEGGSLDDATVRHLAEDVAHALRIARAAGEHVRDEQARILWREVYEDLSEGRPGLHGAATSRAEAQVMRLATLYALLDLSPKIGLAHLNAALAVWHYCNASAAHIFGDASGDGLADQIRELLRAAVPGAGTPRTAINRHFGGHKTKREIDAALEVVERRGWGCRVAESTGGRPAEVWYASRGKSEESEKSPSEADLSSLLSLLSQEIEVVL